jgi:uracil-DNA glycosylase family 4
VERSVDAVTTLDELEREVVACRRCPRLAAWRELVAREKRAAFAGETYWGRPIPGFGDPQARLLILGLAPAAHGANRTGRVFTGDRSGDFLFAALYRAGLANQPRSDHAGDGLRLTEAWIAAAVRCAPPANRPTPAERDACLPWTLRELELLPRVRAVLCLGAFAWAAALRARTVGGLPSPRPLPRLGHATVWFPGDLGGPALVGSYHPSQQNTFTGKLTPAMLDAAIQAAVELSSPAATGE